MAFSLDRVVPWGRSFAEYDRMFSLTPDDLKRRILGCADGPASFNAEATKHGIEVVSVDPLYAFSAEEIRTRIKAVCPQVLEQTWQNRDGFVWNEFRSIEALGWMRLRTMVRFLKDYAAAREAGRYCVAELPKLPFADGTFGLALCSHFLFLYSDHVNEQAHVDSVVELCRVADEVRIFPLVTLGNQPSRYVSAVVRAVEQLGRKAEIEPVSYEFQRGGNQMLRITNGRRPEC
jgi:hypothetical protein